MKLGSGFSLAGGFGAVGVVRVRVDGVMMVVVVVMVVAVVMVVVHMGRHFQSAHAGAERIAEFAIRYVRSRC